MSAPLDPPSPQDHSSSKSSVPIEEYLRSQVRSATKEVMASHPRSAPPGRMALERLARQVLEQLDLTADLAGYVMIELNNAFWEEQFASVPANRRILFLPRCLSIKSTVREQAERLGYRVLVAEGTPQVLALLLQEPFDAVLGVACMDSLDKAFQRVSALGVPNLALPLCGDGCKCTTTDDKRLNGLLRLRQKPQARKTRSYLPLLKASLDIFEPSRLARLLAHTVMADPSTSTELTSPAHQTDAVALEWMGQAGKRLRPFVTLTAYAVGKYGKSMLTCQDNVSDLLPDSVSRVAIAIEALHKASLIHDDIEDDDDQRYGHDTLHRQHGIPFATNVGDFLIGVGYHLIAAESPALGARCVADILNHLANAHLRLSRGQGAELLWWQRQLSDSQKPASARRREQLRMRPIDALSVYAGKTAPAFEAALYAGLRSAEVVLEPGLLRSYARALGVGFQIINDLDNWQLDSSGGVKKGSDALAGRPTLLYCFAQAAAPEAILSLVGNRAEEPEEVFLQRLHKAYEATDAFEKAAGLVERYRARALSLAKEVNEPVIADLMIFLAEAILCQNTGI